MKVNRVIVMTGDKLRHKYWAARILEKCEDAVWVKERQPRAAWGAHMKQASGLMKRHFRGFHAEEKRYFSKRVESKEKLLKERLILSLREGEVNTPRAIEEIRKHKPNLFVTYSTSILRDEFINTFKPAIINFHAGLSPYYRGSGTNVFPFYNEELEYVGVTIHYIDRGIDSGGIVVQGRPKFDREDNTHTVGCKCVELAAELMVEVVREAKERGLPVGQKQDLRVGRLYYKKDFTDEIVRGVYQKLTEGLVERYLAGPLKEVKMVNKIKYE